MTIKSAATFAFIGTLLAAVLLIWDFLSDVVNVAQGLIPAVRLFPALIYAFAAFTLTLFVYVLRKTQH